MAFAHSLVDQFPILLAKIHAGPINTHTKLVLISIELCCINQIAVKHILIQIYTSYIVIYTSHIKICIFIIIITIIIIIHIIIIIIIIIIITIYY